MTKILSLTLKPKSGWVTPLQADTIFGHLCWKIKQKEGKEKLEKFLEEMEQKPFFVVSNVFPKGYIPRPRLKYDFIKEEAKKIKDGKENKENERNKKESDEKNVMNEEFDKIKDYDKEINLIKIEDLKDYFNFSEIKKIESKEEREKKGKEEINKIMEKVKIIQSYGKDREIKTTISRFTSTTLEEQGPYSLPYFSLKEEGELWLLMKVFGEGEVIKEDKIKEYLKLVFTEGFGKRKSIGKGVFEVIEDWKEFKIKEGEKEINLENEEGKYCLSLSNFVPNKNDPTDGFYEIFVKYGKLGEERSIAGSGNFYKKPLIMIKEGATFKANSSSNEHLGRMLAGISADSEVYHYAYGFPLRF